jgi:hypothetical protein
MTKNTKNQPKVKETIEGERNIRLHHTLKLTRQEFNQHMGKAAQILLDKGTIELKSTENVRKYVFEIEIID